jgi:hypothetical protein
MRADLSEQVTQMSKSTSFRNKRMRTWLRGQKEVNMVVTNGDHDGGDQLIWWWWWWWW